MQPDPSHLSSCWIFLLPVFFVAMWALTSVFVGVITGWHSLARRFLAQAEPYGEVKTAGPYFYTVYMRFWSHYSSIIRLRAAADALYLSVLFLFRLGHPPLSIPWQEIKFGRTRFLWRRYVVLTLGNEEQIAMRISERMANALGILDRIPS
jgi:hypothetical protein